MRWLAAGLELENDCEKQMSPEDPAHSWSLWLTCGKSLESAWVVLGTNPPYTP